MFSQDLIERTIEYFKKTYNHEISPETAELYLNALTGLFGSFLNLKKTKDSCKVD
jgi:hypothetical protein